MFKEGFIYSLNMGLFQGIHYPLQELTTAFPESQQDKSSPQDAFRQ